MISSWTNLKKALLCLLEFKIISTHFFWDKMAHYAVCIAQWVQRANFQDFVQSDFKASWAYLNFLSYDWLKIL